MLTELQAKSAKPKPKPYMLRDDRGLYLRVDPSGRKYWILRYWEQKKEHQLSLGSYPEISLKAARIHRDEIQTARAKGLSPSLKSAKAPQTFSDVAAEWLSVRMLNKAENYLRTIHFRLDKYILPSLGDSPMKEITSGNILQLCHNIEATGHEKNAKRVKTIIGQIFRYAATAEYTGSDTASVFPGALRPRKQPALPLPNFHRSR